MTSNYGNDSEYGSNSEYGGGKYDYTNSDPIRNPMEVEPQPEENAYTNSEINNSLGADPAQADGQGNDYDYGYSM